MSIDTSVRMGLNEDMKMLMLKVVNVKRGREIKSAWIKYLRKMPF